MDRSWMRLNRVSDGYLTGVHNFLEFAFSNTLEPKIPCPCVKCLNRQYHLRNEVRSHMIIKGIVPHYDVWYHHGEQYIPMSQRNQPEVSTSESIRVEGDDIHGLIEDVVGHITQEERLAHPPLGWPIDQWTNAVELWGTEKFANKRMQASINRGKQVMKHTCGSESIPKKRVKMMRETGKVVDGVDLFIETHKSKKTNTFIDEESRVTAERLKDVVSQNMNENGTCNLSEQEVFNEVLGPEKKGRERFKGKTGGKKGKKTITEADVERAVVEAVRRENISNLETLRRENIANIQAAIAAMIASGQLMVPPTGPGQDTGSTADEVNEEANTRDRYHFVDKPYDFC